MHIVSIRFCPFTYIFIHASQFQGCVGFASGSLEFKIQKGQCTGGGRWSEESESENLESGLVDGIRRTSSLHSFLFATILLCPHHHLHNQPQNRHFAKPTPSYLVLSTACLLLLLLHRSFHEFKTWNALLKKWSFSGFFWPSNKAGVHMKPC